MLVGHFAVALLGKRMEPRLSLGTLSVAAMLPDLLWPLFLMAGVECVIYRPGRGAANYLDFSHSKIDISHSLLMDVLWAGLLFAIYLVIKRYWGGGWIIFAAVLSHWILDVLSDRGIPLAPGMQTKLGLGLWSSIPLTCLVEGGFWLAAVVLYSRVTRPRNRTGIVAFWIGAALLTLIWCNNIAGPPPPNPRSVPLLTFTLFSGLIAWTFWIDDLRPTELTATAVAGEGPRAR